MKRKKNQNGSRDDDRSKRIKNKKKSKKDRVVIFNVNKWVYYLGGTKTIKNEKLFTFLCHFDQLMGWGGA